MLRPVHQVVVEPYGHELLVKDGQTIFRVANENGLQWPTRCGGAKSCTMCTMVVLDGADNLSKQDADEAFLTAPIARRTGIEAGRLRMACAARVRGQARVQPRHGLGPLSDDQDER